MREALIKLLSKKRLEDITITELCAEAGVHRTTFYMHFDTISDLLDDITDSFSERFTSCFEKNQEALIKEIVTTSPDKIKTGYIVPYLNFIKENKALSRARILKRDRLKLRISPLEYLEDNVLKPFLKRRGVPDEYQEYYTAYFKNGSRAIAEEWLNNGCVESSDAIAEIISEYLITLPRVR